MGTAAHGADVAGAAVVGPEGSTEGVPSSGTRGSHTEFSASNVRTPLSRTPFITILPR